VTGIWAPVVVCALLAGAGAWALSGFLRHCATSDAPILRKGLHVAVAAALGALAGLASSVPEMAAFVVLAVASGLLTVIDLAEERMPDAIVLPLFGITAALLTVAAWTNGQWGQLGRAGLAALALFALYFAMMVFSPDLGFADVKLIAVAGLFLGWFGWGAVVIGACLGWVTYAVPGLVRMVTRKPGERGSLPFGPFIILGAVIGALWAGTLAPW
jgi:leader peptidase (prepilin peptidase)/N-methyltransferase